MIGKIVPFILVGYVQMTVVLILGKLLFDIPIRRSVPLLYAVTMGFIVATLGMGLLVSTVAKTQAPRDAVGFFSHAAEHPALRLYVPARGDAGGGAVDRGRAAAAFYLRNLRAILLRGSGFAKIRADSTVLVAFASGLLVLSAVRFRKTVGWWTSGLVD